MAEATAQVVKTVKCKITFTDDWVEVTSAKGNTLRVTASDYPGEWQAFTPEENKLLNKLMGSQKSPWELELSIPEMVLFKKMVDQAPGKDLLETLATPAQELSERTQSTPANGQIRTASQLIQEDTTRMVVEQVKYRTQGFGDSNREIRITQLQNMMARFKNEQMFMLDYDIPERCKIPGVGSLYTNPRSTFRRFMAYSTNSCPYCFERGLNAPAVQDILQFWQGDGMVGPNGEKVKVRIRKQHPDELRQMCETIQEHLERELFDLHTSLIQSIGNADAALQRTQKEFARRKSEGEEISSTEEQEAELKRRNTIAGAIRAAAKRLDDAIHFAEVHEVTDDFRDALRGVREAVKSQKETQDAEREIAGMRAIKVRIPSV